MTTVKFISRAQAKALLNDWPDNTALISISDTNAESVEIITMTDDDMYFFPTYFKDIDSPESGFSVSEARSMQCFIEDCIDAKQNIIVHCFAGISRSGAIAKWINNHYALGDWYLDDYQGHNRYVYEIMEEAAGCSMAAYYRELEGKE